VFYTGATGENDYYIIKDASNTLVSSKSQYNDDAGTKLTSDDVTVSGSSISITTDASVWSNYYIASYEDKSKFETSKVQSRTPKWPSYAPTMTNYEVCVFQHDVSASDAIKRTACRHF
jgi:hypothetical protein